MSSFPSILHFPKLGACTMTTNFLDNLGNGKGVITKGVFSQSLESLKSLNSLESLENGRNLLCFPQSGGCLKTLESQNSLESLEMDFSERPLFQKTPFSNPTIKTCTCHSVSHQKKKTVFGRFSSLPRRSPPSKTQILFLLSSRRLWHASNNKCPIFARPPPSPPKVPKSLTG